MFACARINDQRCSFVLSRTLQIASNKLKARVFCLRPGTKFTLVGTACKVTNDTNQLLAGLVVLMAEREGSPPEASGKEFVG